MNNELAKRIKNLTDEELLNMVDGDSADFTEEALEVAREEVKARGGTESLYRKIEEQMEQIRQENEKIQMQEELESAEAFERDMHAPRRQGLFSETRKLKDETVNRYLHNMIPGASGHAEQVIVQIQDLIKAVDMPLSCRWGVMEVKTKHLIQRVRRDFLIVESDDFPDHHIYISVRDFGIFLDCIIIFTVEPGVLKKFFSKKLTGTDDVEALSRPRNMLKLQDHGSWTTAVEYCYSQAIDSLVERLGKKPSQVLSREKIFLDIW